MFHAQCRVFTKFAKPPRSDRYHSRNQRRMPARLPLAPRRAAFRDTSPLQLYETPANGSNDRVHDFVLRRALPPTTHRLPPCTISFSAPLDHFFTAGSFSRRDPASFPRLGSITPIIVRDSPFPSRKSIAPPTTKNARFHSESTLALRLKCLTRVQVFRPKLFRLLIIPHGCDECNGEFKKILSRPVRSSVAEPAPSRPIGRTGVRLGYHDRRRSAKLNHRVPAPQPRDPDAIDRNRPIFPPLSVTRR